ncbi:hypothetical protein ACFQI7_09660 [Paenibacillus allorhizosphaerae]|uniref:Uncharacterized protein n=1 Tax=Paenibacillus allorhizosphaerae TaxID=2849866 RepID=A0ABN7TP67_9BACL|nr:hypothetical protein [Paenibacillus allorhizosphaerae]CAG7644374.1 hypothetical protein PAECIP111802_03245 [Paenibacillus allorhizosphaerae]
MKGISSMVAEWLRILLILIIGLPLLHSAELLLLSLFGAKWNEGSVSTVIFANLLIVFMLYRNKLQFGGWYRSHRNRPLPGRVTWLLSVVSVVLLLAAVE